MKKYFLLCLLLLGTFAASANKVDSLRTALAKAGRPAEKISTLNLLAKELFKTGQYDTSAVYSQKALKLAEKQKDKKGMGLACNNLGNLHIIKAEYEEAYKYHSRALKLQLQTGEKQHALDSYNNLGICLYYQGKYPESLKQHLHSLEMGKETGNKTGIARSYSNLGNVYFQQNSMDDALKYYKLAMKMQRELGDSIGVGRGLNNIGSIYLMKGDNARALENFSTSVRIKESIGDVLSVGRSYINMGDIYFQLGHVKTIGAHSRDSLLDLSLAQFEKALTALQKLGDKQAMASTYNNMGLLYVARKDPAKARGYINKALVLANETGSTQDIKSSFNGLAVVDSMTGRYEQSLANYKKFIYYRDQLLSEANTKKTMQAQMDYELGQKELKLVAQRQKMKAEQEKKDLLHEQQLLRQRITWWFVSGTIALVLLLVILFVNRSRLKQKNSYQQMLNQQQKEQATAIMEAQEQERKRIAEDLHDSLGHLLSTAKMHLQSAQETEQKLVQSVQLLNQASEELRNISFNLMPSVLEEEGLTPALSELAEKTQRSGNMSISFQAHDVEDLKFDRAAQFNIYRIVQEAINNILKHAGATEAGIQLIGQPHNLTIMIEDNGRGFDQHQVKKGRGQTNMRARAQWLSGRFHLDSTPGHGTTISIEIPA